MNPIFISNETHIEEMPYQKTVLHVNDVVGAFRPFKCSTSKQTQKLIIIYGQRALLQKTKSGTLQGGDGRGISRHLKSYR